MERNFAGRNSIGLGTRLLLCDLDHHDQHDQQTSLAAMLGMLIPVTWISSESQNTRGAWKGHLNHFIPCDHE